LVAKYKNNPLQNVALKNTQIRSGAILDFDKNNNVIGIEFLHVFFPN